MSTTPDPDAQDVPVRAQALLAAARALFVEQGYAGTSLEAVVARAGGSRREVYRHFGDKHGLFRAMLRETFAAAMAPLDRLALSDAAPAEALAEVGHALVAALTDPALLGPMRRVLAEAQAFPDVAALAFAEGPGRVTARIADWLAAEATAGRIACADPAAAAALFVDMLRGPFVVGEVLGLGTPSPPEARAAHVARVVAVFLRGVAAL